METRPAEAWKQTGGVASSALSLSAAQPPSSLKLVLTTNPLLWPPLRPPLGLLLGPHVSPWVMAWVPRGPCACRLWELMCVSVGLHTFQELPSAKPSFPLRLRYPPFQAHPLPWQQEAEA